MRFDSGHPAILVVDIAESDGVGRALVRRSDDVVLGRGRGIDHEREGIVEAQVTSARELSEAEQEELIGAIERLTQQRVQAKFGFDAALVGGAVVQIGSTIYDGSVREQLARLRQELEADS